MAQPLYSGIMPDLSANRVESKAFVDSFFESLEVESYKAPSQNRIWRIIRAFCELKNQPYMANEIHDQFETCLAKKPFKEDLWAEAVNLEGTGELDMDEEDEQDGEDE
jgi:hypothetical protein